MKHKFIAKRYWKDQSTAMGQSDVLAKSFDDVIDLSLGDPDLTTDFRIIDAAFADAKAGHTKYTDFRGDPELGERLRRRGILLRDCRSFRGLAPGWYRAAVRGPEDNRRLLETIGEEMKWQSGS